MAEVKEVSEWVRHNCGVHTTRQWRALKRRQLDAALKCLRGYNLGSAYTPEFTAFLDALRLLYTVRKAISTKEWK